MPDEVKVKNAWELVLEVVKTHQLEGQIIKEIQFLISEGNQAIKKATKEQGKTLFGAIAKDLAPTNTLTENPFYFGYDPLNVLIKKEYENLNLSNYNLLKTLGEKLNYIQVYKPNFEIDNFQDFKNLVHLFAQKSSFINATAIPKILWLIKNDHFRFHVKSYSLNIDIPLYIPNILDEFYEYQGNLLWTKDIGILFYDNLGSEVKVAQTLTGPFEPLLAILPGAEKIEHPEKGTYATFLPHGA